MPNVRKVLQIFQIHSEVLSFKRQVTSNGLPPENPYPCLIRFCGGYGGRVAIKNLLLAEK